MVNTRRNISLWLLVFLRVLSLYDPQATAYLDGRVVFTFRNGAKVSTTI